MYVDDCARHDRRLCERHGGSRQAALSARRPQVRIRAADRLGDTRGGSDSLAGAENAEGQNLTSAAETKTGNTKALPSFPRPPPDGNGNTVFAAVTNLNAHLTALHASLQPRTALLLFSGHSDPCSMSALPLAARGTKLARISGTGIRAVMERPEELATVGLSTADDRSLEEAVVRARMGLFVSVKT